MTNYELGNNGSDLTPKAILVPNDTLDRVYELQVEVCELQKQPLSGDILEDADIIYGIADARTRLATYYTNE